MTIIEAITKIDSLKYNTYSQEDKVDWLSRLDWMVKRQIIDTHEGGEAVPFTGYDADTDLHTVLLIPAPFDEIYLRWLEAQIDYTNGEMDKFNASIIMYNTAYEAFENYYNRNHRPAKKGRRFIF
jgi:hypothetical protein